jgi:hypothetical protein
MIHGDRFPVTPGPLLRAAKWTGGVWVQLVAPTDVNDWLVERSDGIRADGFMLWASANRFSSVGDAGYRNWTSFQADDNNASTVSSGAATTTMVAGGGRFMFRVFETIALTIGGVRAGGPAVYSLNDILKVSENGLLCNDPDANLLAATGGTAVVPVGMCSAAPNARSGDRLGLDLKF